MNTTSKIFVTIGAVVAFLFFFAILTHANKESGSTPGILGIILLLGLLAGLRAIWKKPKEE